MCACVIVESQRKVILYLLMIMNVVFDIKNNKSKVSSLLLNQSYPFDLSCLQDP